MPDVDSTQKRGMTEKEKSIAAMSVNVGHKVQSFDLWALGITIVIGGQYFAWNVGLEAGFGSFALATFFIGTAYICLIMCVSEISSGLPFAGGAYGLARCSLGFYPGYLIGCCEALEYIVYVATSALSLGTMICSVFNLDLSYQPLIWFLFYASALVIQITGGHLFWRSTIVLALVSIGIVFVYCFGCLKNVNFDRYARYNDEGPISSYDNLFQGGMSTFMLVMPLAAWFYVGVESLAFSADVVTDPKTNLPIGFMSCVLTLFATSIFVLFVSSSLSPGVQALSSELAVFDPGFIQIFNIPDNAALALSIPATYATAFGFIFPYGKLLQALANSKLLPDPLDWLTETSKTPYVAMLVGSVIGYVLCVIVYFYPYLGSQLFNICILNGFMAYISQCVGYIVLQFKFTSIKRRFHSPVGIYGAVYAILVFALAAISVIGFQGDNQFSLIVIVCLMIMLSTYYYFISRHRQTFSEAEQKIMFVAHVINFNVNRNRHPSHKNSSASRSKVTPSNKPSNLNRSSHQSKSKVDPDDGDMTARAENGPSQTTSHTPKRRSLPLTKPEGQSHRISEQSKFPVPNELQNEPVVSDATGSQLAMKTPVSSRSVVKAFPEGDENDVEVLVI